jgi:acetyl-CoA carboxylase biotin carboxyl carrier protein
MTTPDLPLTPEDVADIIAILDGSAYDTLEVSTLRFVLKLARGGAGTPASGWTQEWRHAAGAAPLPTAAAEAPADDDAADGLVAVRAPLPGTFYRAPQPGAAPFVEVGAQVAQDTVVGIVETMKMMNSVPAMVRGEVVAILVANGTMVGNDTVLMRVRPPA